MQLTRKCAGCKQDIRKDEMVQYFSPTGKTSAWYCHTCLEEKLEREKFSQKVCTIFQLKSPGPRIWTERKRLRTKYGYTDDTIINCLEYLYEVKKIDKLAETLVLVNPQNVAKMKIWQAERRALGGSIIAAITQTQAKEHIIDIPEPVSKKEKIDLDADLYDE